MIAAVSNTGTLRFRVFDCRFTGPLFLDFLKRLVRDNQGRKIVLIVDGHPAHRARIVRDWVAANPELIELHFLPGQGRALLPRTPRHLRRRANYLTPRVSTWATSGESRLICWALPERLAGTSTPHP
jgi:hypothetical protein